MTFCEWCGSPERGALLCIHGEYIDKEGWMKGRKGKRNGRRKGRRERGREQGRKRKEGKGGRREGGEMKAFILIQSLSKCHNP